MPRPNLERVNQFPLGGLVLRHGTAQIILKLILFYYLNNKIMQLLKLLCRYQYTSTSCHDIGKEKYDLQADHAVSEEFPV